MTLQRCRAGWTSCRRSGGGNVAHTTLSTTRKATRRSHTHKLRSTAADVRTHKHATKRPRTVHTTLYHTYTHTPLRRPSVNFILFGAHAHNGTALCVKNITYIHIHRCYVRVSVLRNSRSDDGYTTHYMHGRIAALDSRRRLATRATTAGGGGDGRRRRRQWTVGGWRRWWLSGHPAPAPPSNASL